jgi:hypothetical protein
MRHPVQLEKYLAKTATQSKDMFKMLVELEKITQSTNKPGKAVAEQVEEFNQTYNSVTEQQKQI